MRPTIHTIGYLLVLAALWYAALSQANPTAYLLFFFWLSVGLVSLVHAWINVKGLGAAAIPGAHGFAGKSPLIPVRVSNPSINARYGISFSWRAGLPERVDRVEPASFSEVQLTGPALPRGSYSLEEIMARSEFPLGLVQFRTRLRLTGELDIYPEPNGIRELPATASLAESAATGKRREGDDFAGVRPYRPGDSQRHVDWRAVARGQPLLVKQFEGAIGGVVEFDLDQTPGPDLEAKLSQLCLWITEAERTEVEYGLTLGATRLEPSCGQAHLHACLRALARYPAA